MNIPTRNALAVRWVPPVLKITPTPWWLWNRARMKANTTMPRISKMTPVLLTMATSRTP